MSKMIGKVSNGRNLMETTAISRSKASLITAKLLEKLIMRQVRTLQDDVLHQRIDNLG